MIRRGILEVATGRLVMRAPRQWDVRGSRKEVWREYSVYLGESRRTVQMGNLGAEYKEM